MLDVLADDYRYCTVCHGASGNGNVAIQAPALAGIEPWYLRARLAAYREQHLGRDFGADPAGTEMRTVAREIDDERLAAIAAYVAAFGIEPQPAQVTGNAASGRRLYSQHCATCHGARGEGNELLRAPALARLNDWYLVSAVAKYRAGLRGSHADDTYGLQMQVFARALPADFQLEDVAAWLHTQRRPTK